MSSDLINQIEFLVGSIGVTLAIFFGAFLLITNRSQPKANVFLAIYLLAFALRIGKSLFHYDFEIPATIRTLILSTLYVVGPSIWLYTYYLKSATSSIKPKDLLHFMPFMIAFCASPFIPNDGTSDLFSWFYDGTILSMFIYTISSLRWNWNSNTITAKSKRVRSWLSFFLIANLILVIIYWLASKFIASFYEGISICFSLVVVLCSIRALRNPSLFKVDKEKYSNSNVTSTVAYNLSQKLEELMKRDQPFLDPEMNLGKLSVLLDCSSKELSQVINQKFNINYAQYIVQYRLEESKRRLIDEKHAHLSIAAIAHDSGFNSISSFNSQFKRIVGMTAKEYRMNN